jgi:hypothetical protein
MLVHDSAHSSKHDPISAHFGTPRPSILGPTWIFRSPEEIISLFDAATSESAAPAALTELTNIANRQHFAVTESQLDFLLTIVATSDPFHSLALRLLAELTTFSDPCILNFMCTPAAVRIIWSRFPSPSSAAILRSCVHFDRTVLHIFTDPAIQSGVISMFDPTFPCFEFVMELFSHVFAQFSAVVPPMDVFLNAVFATVAGPPNDSDLFWHAVSALNTILESAPQLIVERLAEHLPRICSEADEDNSTIVLQLLALVARHKRPRLSGQAISCHFFVKKFFGTKRSLFRRVGFRRCGGCHCGFGLSEADRSFFGGSENGSKS